MAKKATEATPKQKALSAAKIALDKATEAHEKSATPANKTALETAQKHYDAANAEVKRENFVRVAGGRVKKARIAIRNLGNINSLRTYSYSEADVTKAYDAIVEMANTAKAKMLDGLRTKSAVSAPKDEFSF